MDIGIAVASGGQSWQVVERAEQLGFDHAWFYDTQQLCGDVFVAMAGAAMRTSRIRLGTGVLIPSNRIAPVAANAFATLNRMAPGRIDFGVGTGFTGRRTMGLGAMKLKEMEDYIRVVYGMLAGETVDYALEGGEHKVRFLNPELGFIDLDAPVRLHVSAFGQRSRALTAKLKAAWINIVFAERTGIRDIERMQASWREAGHDPGELCASMIMIGRILEPDEPYDSSQAMIEAGPAAAVFLHSVVENEALSGQRINLPPAQRELADRYHALYDSYRPEDARYLSLHRGHMMFVRDDERSLITGELIRAKSFTGTRDDVIERLTQLKQAGYGRISVQLMPGHENAIEGWAGVLQAVQAA